jgi:hypothetical protein
MRRITDVPLSTNLKMLNGNSLHKNWRPPKKKFIYDIVKSNEYVYFYNIFIIKLL